MEDPKPKALLFRMLLIPLIFLSDWIMQSSVADMDISDIESSMGPKSSMCIWTCKLYRFEMITPPARLATTEEFRLKESIEDSETCVIELDGDKKIPGEVLLAIVEKVVAQIGQHPDFAKKISFEIEGKTLKVILEADYREFPHFRKVSLEQYESQNREYAVAVREFIKRKQERNDLFGDVIYGIPNASDFKRLTKHEDPRWQNTENECYPLTIGNAKSGKDHYSHKEEIYALIKEEKDGEKMYRHTQKSKPIR